MLRTTKSASMAIAAVAWALILTQPLRAEDLGSGTRISLVQVPEWPITAPATAALAAGTPGTARLRPTLALAPAMPVIESAAAPARFTEKLGHNDSDGLQLLGARNEMRLSAAWRGHIATHSELHVAPLAWDVSLKTTSRRGLLAQVAIHW
jgi:hypothetical protein